MSVRASRLSPCSGRRPSCAAPGAAVRPGGSAVAGSRLSLWLSVSRRPGTWRCGRRRPRGQRRHQAEAEPSRGFPLALRPSLGYCTSRFELGSPRASPSATVPACRVSSRFGPRRRAARGAGRGGNRIFIYHYRHSSTSSGSYFFCLTHITRDSDNYTFRLSLDSVTLSSTSVVLELRFIAVLGGPPSQSQPCLAAAWPLPCSAASLLPRCRYPPRCA